MYTNQTRSCAVQAQPSGVCLMKGGPGLTKNCPVMCIRKVLIQKLKGKFWKKDRSWENGMCVCVCVCVCVCAFSRSVVSDSATLWTVAHQSPVHGILQARILEWVAISSNPGVETQLPMPPALQADALSAGPSGKAPRVMAACQ